jgi:hypothetical protein
MTTPSVVLNCGGNKKKTRKEKKKIPKIVATLVYASSQGQRTHSARNKIPKIVATFIYASSQGQRTHSAQTKTSTTKVGQHARRLAISVKLYDVSSQLKESGPS